MNPIDDSGMSRKSDHHMCVKTIRDPVHSELYLTPLEQLLIDRPQFQRLRFVLQQSTAYLTFPTNVTSRFAHSLGAAHVAGKMFLSALLNSTRVDAAKFLTDARKLIVVYGTGLSDSTINKVFADPCACWIGNPLTYETQPPVTELPPPITFGSGADDGQTGSADESTIVSILWQTVRFATLVHDLGHLPMSHLFEDAVADFDEHHFDVHQGKRLHSQVTEAFLKSYENDRLQTEGLIQNQLKLHEMIGCLLFRDVEGLIDGADSNSTQLLLVVTNLAKATVVIEPRKDPSKEQDRGIFQVLRFLHSIIAGELDADRIDYVARDALACSFGRYVGSTDRLIRGQTLVCESAQYQLALNFRVVPDLEFFFLQRLFEFRSIVFDHNVLRSEAILRRVIIDLICEAHDPRSTILDILRRYRFWYEPDKRSASGVFGPLYVSSDTIGRFDDAWLRSLLFTVWDFLTDEQAQRRQLPDRQQRLRTFIGAILNRDVSVCWTVNKTESDTLQLFEELVEKLLSMGQESVTERGYAEELVRSIFFNASMASTVSKHLTREFGGAGASQLTPLVAYERPSFPPVSDVKYSLKVVLRDRSIRPLAEVSPFLWNLAESLVPTAGAVAASPIAARHEGGTREVIRLPFYALRVFLVGDFIHNLRSAGRETAMARSDVRNRCVSALANAARDIANSDREKTGQRN